MKLSLHMHFALAAVRKEPGRAINTYPGGMRSVDALRRRRLVRVTEDSIVTPTELGQEVHVHQFAIRLHMDGCHYFTSVYACECGAALRDYGERDLKGDPYSAIWMEPSGANEDEPCKRCQELMDGARPVYRRELQERKAAA